MIFNNRFQRVRRLEEFFQLLDGAGWEVADVLQVAFERRAVGNNEHTIVALPLPLRRLNYLEDAGCETSPVSATLQRERASQALFASSALTEHDFVRLRLGRHRGCDMTNYAKLPTTAPSGVVPSPNPPCRAGSGASNPPIALEIEYPQREKSRHCRARLPLRRLDWQDRAPAR
jgi:hypothetical protein